MVDRMTRREACAILGVAETATPEEVHDAYRKASRRWHPDTNLSAKEEAAEKFICATEAYELLLELGTMPPVLRPAMTPAEYASGGMVGEYKPVATNGRRPGAPRWHSVNYARRDMLRRMGDFGALVALILSILVIIGLAGSAFTGDDGGGESSSIQYNGDVEAKRDKPSEDDTGSSAWLTILLVAMVFIVYAGVFWGFVVLFVRGVQKTRASVRRRRKRPRKPRVESPS